MYASFGGLGSELLMRICLEEGKMDYEISSMQSEPIRISGNQPMENDTIPQIDSYQVYSVMKAELSKADK